MGTDYPYSHVAVTWSTANVRCWGARTSSMRLREGDASVNDNNEELIRKVFEADRFDIHYLKFRTLLTLL